MTNKYEFKHGNKTYIINKFGAIAGRAIVAQYPLTMILQNKEYVRNEEVMMRLMSHVEIVLSDGSTQALTTRALIDNHVADWSDLVSIELAALKYNAPQFFDGTAGSLLSKADNWLSAKLSEIMANAIGENLRNVTEHNKQE